MNAARIYGQSPTVTYGYSSFVTATPTQVYAFSDNSFYKGQVLSSSSSVSRVADIVGQGLSYLKNNPASVARSLSGLGLSLVATPVVDYVANKAADIVNSGVDYLLGKPSTLLNRVASNDNSSTAPIPVSSPSVSPDYVVSGNRVGSTGATSSGVNYVSPAPTAKPYDIPAPVVSSSPSLLSVLETQNNILRAGLLSVVSAVSQRPISSSPAGSGSSPVTVQNIIDFAPLTEAVKLIPAAMPSKAKIEAVAEAKKDALEFDKTARAQNISGYEVLSIPREDRAAHYAQGAKLGYDKNSFSVDDIDFGLDDVLSQIGHISYSGVYGSVMNAASKIISGDIDYEPSLADDFIITSYIQGLL